MDSVRGTFHEISINYIPEGLDRMDGVVGIVCALFSLVRSQATMATRMEAWRPWRRELPVARLKTWRNTMATPFRPVDGGWVEFMWDSYQLNVKPGLIHWAEMVNICDIFGSCFAGSSATSVGLWFKQAVTGGRGDLYLWSRQERGRSLH